VAARWTDLVDPTREKVLGVLPIQVDPEVVEALVALVLYRWRRWI
jgi:hypothetical protein